MVLAFDCAKTRTAVRDELMDKSDPKNWAPRFGVSARIPKPLFQIRRDDPMYRKKAEVARLLSKDPTEISMDLKTRTITLNGTILAYQDANWSMVHTAGLDAALAARGQ